MWENESAFFWEVSISMFDGVHSLLFMWRLESDHLTCTYSSLSFLFSFPPPSYPPFICTFACGMLCPLCPQFLSLLLSASSFVKMSIICYQLVPTGFVSLHFYTYTHVLHPPPFTVFLFLCSPSYLFLYLSLLFLSSSTSESTILSLFLLFFHDCSGGNSVC